jgi:hypothetical protein
MAVLFDPADDYVRSVLDVAKINGEIRLADLDAICETGIDTRSNIPMHDILDSLHAIANTGIEVESDARTRGASGRRFPPGYERVRQEGRLGSVDWVRMDPAAAGRRARLSPTFYALKESGLFRPTSRQEAAAPFRLASRRSAPGMLAKSDIKKCAKTRQKRQKAHPIIKVVRVAPVADRKRGNPSQN